MKGNIELRHLRYFLAVAEELHFGRAAGRLGIAQPPLSQQIQRLEEAVGARLLERRPVALTPAGEALRGVARRTLSQVESGVEATRRAARGETGTLRIGFAASTLLTPLPGCIRRFRRRHPQVSLSLRELATYRQVEALRDGTIDVGVLREAPRADDLSHETLLEEEFVAVLPPRHPLAGRRRLPPRRLATEPFVLFPRHVAPALHDQVRDLCRDAGFRPEVVQEALEWLTIVGLVEAGLGVSLVPASFRRLRWGRVTYQPLAGTAVHTATRVAVRRDGAPPTARRFLDVARGAVGPRPVRA